jgi:hypothetical protein
MANNVRVTELDFDQIKTNIKNFLRNQSQFTDYDFEASNLSVLMDILAYNTHYNAILANMVSNEMFLDTAIKRSSVVSLAKQLGYMPQSRRCATALINVELQNITGTPNFITLDPGKAFTTSIDGTAYNFYTLDSHVATPVSGVYTFSDIKLYQGRQLEFYYTVAAGSSPANKYEIPNADIDTQTIRVAVQYAGTSSYSETYQMATDITTIDSTSQVFFLQENTRGFYEIFFGDDVVGRNLDAGDTIKISYLVTDGAAANVSNTLDVNWTTTAIAGETAGDRTITTIIKPSGGLDKEDIESIRFRSINNYTAQGRAVTKTDYAKLIQDAAPGAESVNVWGGEKNDPPVYGKTFISIKPKTGYVLTTAEKTRIINDILTPRSVITAQHEFVDPTFTYLTFRIDVRYSSARTSRSAAQIQSLVDAEVRSFMTANLSKFNSIFYRSQLEEILMDVDDAILSVNVLFDLHKRLPLVPNVRLTFGSTINFPSKLHPNELRSSYFYFTDENGVHAAQVRDVPDQSPPDYEGTGQLETFDLETGEILDRPGSVNYGTGIITLNASAPLVLSGYLGSATELIAYAGLQESVGDIFPGFNEILVLDEKTADPIANVRNGITINVVAVNS